MDRGNKAEMATTVGHSRLSFGLYEVDLQTGELWKGGFRIKLQSQPFKVLTALLEKPGQVVTREELQLRLWGRDTVVDFDHSLGTAINKIREALGDSAENPRFIETLSRRGYRFIAPVAEVESAFASASAKSVAGVPPKLDAFDLHTGGSGVETVAPMELGEAASPPVPPEAGVAADRRSRRIWWPVACGAAAAVSLVAGYVWGTSGTETAPQHITQLTRNGHLAPGGSGDTGEADHVEDLAASATDGIHLFTSTIESGKSSLVAVALSGGSVSPVPTPDEVASPALGDLSPDGSRLLLRNHLSPESEQPLWVVPSIGGSALRVGNVLAHDATWMPDGESILYAAGNDIYLTKLTENAPKIYASVPGRAFWLRWQPGGKLLRFTLIDPIAHTFSLWQISTDDRKAQPVLPGWTQPSSECCGVWTADGKSFVFQSSHGGGANLWQMRGDSVRNPVRLTDGPLRFQAPVSARTGSTIYFLGVDARSEMKRYSAETRQLAPDLSFLSTAIRVDFSRDGKWVIWTDDAGLLWRARTDGTEKLQLTPNSVDVFLARFSPDGKQVALMGREPGKAWQIYLVQAGGGELQRLLQESRNAGDPSWSPDGQSIVFGRVNDTMGKEAAERNLQVMRLNSHSVERVPGSDNMFSPRWSPDGKYIAALTLDQRQIRLYSLEDHTWKALPVNSGADPIWSPDSRFLYVHGRLDPAQPIYRVSIPDGQVEQVVRLADVTKDGAVDFVLGGLTPDNHLLIRERIFTGNFYSLNLKAR